MIALLVVAMICGTVLLIGQRASVTLTTKWDSDRRQALATASIEADEAATRYANDRDLDARLVVVAEREIALKERLAVTRPAQEPMPEDLHNRITSWEDEFAQDSERATISSLYAEFGDWEKVRTKLGPLVTA